MLDYISIINRKLRKIFILFLKISFITILTRLYSQSKWIKILKEIYFGRLKFIFLVRKMLIYGLVKPLFNNKNLLKSSIKTNFSIFYLKINFFHLFYSFKKKIKCLFQFIELIRKTTKYKNHYYKLLNFS